MTKISIDPWMASWAGAMAHTIGCTLHPLENVKLRFQANDMAKNNPIPQYKGIIDSLKKVGRDEGISALYRGAGINLVAGVLANYIFFYVYNDGKRRYGVDQSNISSWKTGMISLKAGMISCTLTCPLWVVKTRLALNRNKNEQRSGMIYRTVRDMYRQEGIRKFYAGYVPSLFMSLHGVIQMYVYENVNKAFGF